MRILLLVLFCFAFLTAAFAQVPANQGKKNLLKTDSTKLQVRTFDAERLNAFKNDPDFEYIPPKREASTWIDMILMLILEFIARLLDFTMNTVYGKILFYGICLAIVLFAIIRLLNVDVREIFYSAKRASSMPVITEEENIHEINFEKDIQEAIRRKNYREGVRLIFLYALKKLSDQQLIHWKPGKTNDDYLAEVRQHKIRTSLHELRLYFDYAWYGHFDVNENTFREIQEVFADFNKKLF